jgi:threonylcarbamoyladenosine tRNA methylthiotransferase MtaB
MVLRCIYNFNCADMNEKASISFHTLGCKLNQAESEFLLHRFLMAGYRAANSDSPADICVLNTCTVTHIADRKSRHMVRLLRKRNPDGFIVATGCYAERAADQLKKAGAHLVVDNAQKTDLLNLIETNFTLQQPAPSEACPAGAVSRVRSFIKVQDGCNNYCSYCIVPYVRRGEVSLPVEDIIEEIQSRVVAGYKEVVLTGTRIGTYDNDGVSLADLVRYILHDTRIERLHLSSLQPRELSPQLVDLLREPRLCRHIHMPLQSGSDTVLARMKRRYSLAEYNDAVARIRDIAPDTAVTTDIMTGFPGENEEEFDESYRYCRDMDFADIHVFQYSVRPLTSAALMPEQVPERIKKERSNRMLKLAEECSRRFRERFLGQTVQVLWESRIDKDGGIYSGLTGNYIRVFTRSSTDLTNTIAPVCLVEHYKGGLWGEIAR